MQLLMHLKKQTVPTIKLLMHLKKQAVPTIKLNQISKNKLMILK